MRVAQKKNDEKKNNNKNQTNLYPPITTEKI